uniref:HTH psq-type domain-containing protein n=1 Tax=Neolamprologus brichardi TaxID=32507 RepID=A0A3Q4HHB0_NEOBR
MRTSTLPAIVTAHQSRKGYKVISKQFKVHHSTLRKIVHKWKTFKSAVNLPKWSSRCIHPKVRPAVQRETTGNHIATSSSFK